MRRGPLPGFRDFYPAELAERAFIFSTWREVVRRYGFSEYDGPPLEPLDLYTQKSGEEIITQLYSFRDKGERDVSLRPEMTPTVARMVAARANALRKPVRWFSIPQLFRYERQQRGRLREHFQLNVDIFGEPGVSADAELLAAAIDIMREFGLTSDDVKVRYSDRRLLNALLRDRDIPEAAIGSVYAVLDKFERQPRDVSIEKLIRAGISLKESERLVEFTESSLAAGSLESIFAALRTDEGTRVWHETFEYTQRVRALIGADAADWLRFDLSIVRGLAYYTGVVFELFDAHGEFRAICGGGRYDDLLGSLGGVAMPAIGFGMGDVVLGELLRSRNKLSPRPERIDYWVAAEEQVKDDAVLVTAGKLRRYWKKRVEYSLRPQTLTKQLRNANTAGALYAVILRSATHGVVKSLRSSEERDVHLETWLGGQIISSDAHGDFALTAALYTPNSPFVTTVGNVDE